MPLLDRDINDFTRALIYSRDYNGWDFIKVMTNGHFMPEAYGATVEFSRNPLNWFGTVLRYPVRDPEDAKKLSILEAKKNPVFIREAVIIENLVKHYRGTVPVIATIFNPITSFQEISSSLNPLFTQVMIRHHKDALRRALDSLTATIKNYLDLLIAAGIDGIFFANQYASKKIISGEEYDLWVTPYDNDILSHIKNKTWFNMAHIHGQSNLWFDKYAGTNYQALNWENTPQGVPASAIAGVAQVAKQFPAQVLITGLDQNHDFISPKNDRDAVKKLLKKRYLRVKKELSSNRFVFAPGCTLPLDVPNYLFALMQEVVEEEGRLEE
jgi:uroporphyrinogen decarboxylase